MANTPEPDPRKYPIPLYLNQKYVFDLLAMMEGGLSQLETIKTTHSTRDDASSRASGEIGIKNVFAFLGVSLQGEKSKLAQSVDAAETTRERVHTPNSLFAKMRERLHEEGLLGAETQVTTGSFVEVHATLEKNPLIDALESLRSILGTAILFEDKPSSTQLRHQGGGKKVTGLQPPRSESERILAQLESLLAQLQSEGTIDLLGRISNTDARLIASIDRAYLGDPSMTDLSEGDYIVLGKVTKVLSKGNAESINLLRKTSLGRVQGQILQSMKDVVANAQAFGLTMPDLVTEVSGPAIQILPIAIFA